MLRRRSQLATVLVLALLEDLPPAPPAPRMSMVMSRKLSRFTMVLSLCTMVSAAAVVWAAAV